MPPPHPQKIKYKLKVSEQLFYGFELQKSNFGGKGTPFSELLSREFSNWEKDTTVTESA